MSVIDTTTGSELNLNEIYGFLMNVVSNAGNIVRDAYFKKKTLENKISFADIVTETDKKVENYLFDTLRTKYTTHLFIGEESTNGKVKFLDNPTWIIDPIDGTTNFVHQFPYCAISIGFYVNRVAQIGVVFNPIRDELFSAVRGQGAYLNGKTLKPSGVTELNKAQIIAEFGSDRDPVKLETKTDNMRRLIGKCHSIRSLGSCALNMCYVANGSAELYFEYGCHIWDFAAASLIATEAGCVIVDPNGGEFDLVNRRIVCSTSQELADEVVKLLVTVDYPAD